VTAWVLPPDELLGGVVGAARDPDEEGCDELSSLLDEELPPGVAVLAGVLGVPDDVAAWPDASAPVMAPTTPSPPMAAATATWRRRRIASSREAGVFLRCCGLIAAAPR
jgi:hypothetical protein